eukprot:15221287-Alexandrium_andersonii.AAC.1
MKALSDFRRNNYISGKFRKRLIDWAQWKRQYGIRISFTEREKEAQMDYSEFLAHHTARGKGVAWVDSEWDRLLKSDCDREGEGLNVRLWVGLRKTRFRDRTRFEENLVEE